jgi:hypothetical protein
MVKVNNEIMEAVPADTDPQLRLHALEYLYDTVGWALFCKGGGKDLGASPQAEPKDQTFELGEDGTISEDAEAPPETPSPQKDDVKKVSSGKPVKKIRKGKVKPIKSKKAKWDETQFLRKSLKEIYRTKGEYTDWLREQYQKELQFYRAILKGDRSYTELYPELDELGIFDSDMEEEIESSTRAQLQEMAENLREEIRIIDEIPDEDWKKVANSPNPKITLGLLLGAEARDVKENFTTAVLVRMRAQRMGQRSAFYTWTGPKMWDGLEDFEVQVDRLVESVLEPLLAYETAGLLENDLEEKSE